MSHSKFMKANKNDIILLNTLYKNSRGSAPKKTVLLKNKNKNTVVGTL